MLVCVLLFATSFSIFFGVICLSELVKTKYLIAQLHLMCGENRNYKVSL